MIPQRELLDLRGEWSLRLDVIEKDYVLGWLLGAIGQQPALRESWIFKGGTCLRKCYFETYRFSEDLDFTIVDGGPEEPHDLVPIFTEIAEWFQDEVGIEIVVDDSSFRRRRNRRGNPTTEGRIAFRGPSQQQPQLPKVKLDLTSDELLGESPVWTDVLHPYSDAPNPLATVASYSLAELHAEKIRALAERCRPRDLYDVILIQRHSDLVDRAGDVLAILEAKCRFAGIALPKLATIRDSPFRAELEQEWESMLGHQLPYLPDVQDMWNDLAVLFDWLEGTVPVTVPPRVERRDLDEAWVTPRSVTTWHTQAPLDLIRFAGANRLTVEVNYHPIGGGRVGWREVAPLSLRLTKAGHLLLFVINDHGELRGYRVDRILGARVAGHRYSAPYRVEF
ncbi:MAG TPA: nucleotidyl transferase AbiEii/AbiGii toxin family protein [Nitriliruptorales bacterium]